MECRGIVAGSWSSREMTVISRSVTLGGISRCPTSCADGAGDPSRGALWRRHQPAAGTRPLRNRPESAAGAMSPCAVRHQCPEAAWADTTIKRHSDENGGYGWTRPGGSISTPERRRPPCGAAELLAARAAHRKLGEPRW